MAEDDGRPSALHRDAQLRRAEGVVRRDARIGGERSRRRRAPFGAQDLAGDLERGVGGRNAAVDRALQQRLLDLVDRHAAADRGAAVQLELLPARQPHRHAEHEQAPRVVVEAGAAPDVVPGVARDQALEVGVELARAGERAVDPLVAEHGAAVGEAAIEVVAAVGGWCSCGHGRLVRRGEARAGGRAAPRPSTPARRAAASTSKAASSAAASMARARRDRRAAATASCTPSRAARADSVASSACACALPSVGASSAAAASANTVPCWRSMLSRMRAASTSSPARRRPGRRARRARRGRATATRPARPATRRGRARAPGAIAAEQRGGVMRRAQRGGDRGHRRDRILLLRHRRRAAAARRPSARRPRRPRPARAARGRGRSCRASRTARRPRSRAPTQSSRWTCQAPSAEARPSRAARRRATAGPLSPSDASVPTAPPNCSRSAAAPARAQALARPRAAARPRRRS